MHVGNVTSEDGRLPIPMVIGYVDPTFADGSPRNHRKDVLYKFSVWPRTSCVLCRKYIESRHHTDPNGEYLCNNCSTACYEVRYMIDSVTAARIRLGRAKDLPVRARNLNRFFRSTKKLKLSHDPLGLKSKLKLLVEVHKELTEMIDEGKNLSATKRALANHMARTIVRSIQAELTMREMR